jgi:hypothetical protein
MKDKYSVPRRQGQSGHGPDIAVCPLMTQLRHARLKIAAVQLDL